MLYDVKTTRKLEKKIISQNNTELSLMFKAGTAIFNHINELNKKDIIILIGPGNNGGDGYALAIQAFLNNYNINCITHKLHTLCLFGFLLFAVLNAIFCAEIIFFSYNVELFYCLF